jgi:hypothetical protein
MICAIVWGEDESFGRLNNSLAMNGTGIVDHDVVLPGVEPGVTYTYVVQGTTADGTLYRSDTGTFRLDRPDGSAEAEGDADLGENLAGGASISGVSSEFSQAFAAGKAIDEDDATEWSTTGDGDEGWIELDLGAESDISGVEFVTRSMADGSARTTTYTVTIDGAAPRGPFDAATVAQRSPVELEARGRVVRFDIDASTGGNVGAVEIRVFGPDG